MKIKVSEASPEQLDKMVWMASGSEPAWESLTCYSPTTLWEQAGPLIDELDIAMSPMPDGLWRAYAPTGTRWAARVKVFTWGVKQEGYTPLVAAMRAYVASKLGEEVEMPVALKTYEVVIRATITKTLSVQAQSEEAAAELAHSEFSVECDGDERYDQDTLSVMEVSK